MGMDIFWDNEKRVKRSRQDVIVQDSSYIPSFSEQTSDYSSSAGTSGGFSVTD